MRFVRRSTDRSCRPSLRLRYPRIEEVAAGRLIEKFSGPRESRPSGRRNDDQPTVSATGGPDGVEVTVGGRTHELSRAEADELRAALGDALTERREFLRTTGEHREDGSYVVARRGASSAGHRKVFEGFEELERLYERLPAEFAAEDVGRTGLTGGRRHMLVHHFAEHPAFGCSLVRHQPLTARKSGGDGGES